MRTQKRLAQTTIDGEVKKKRFFWAWAFLIPGSHITVGLGQLSRRHLLRTNVAENNYARTGKKKKKKIKKTTHV